MRQPVVAGRFYAGDELGCRSHLARVDVENPELPEGLPETPIAAIVPHAGWDCSGRVTMKTFRALEAKVPPGATFIVFGSVHSYGVSRASVYSHGAWQTPLGPVVVDEALAKSLLDGAGDLLMDDTSAHSTEHSIEVQLPMIQAVFGDCPVVPIATPPRADSHEVGARVARIARDSGRQVFFIGTTDLTHYGPTGYGFAPAGPGRQGLEWVKNENDPRMIDLMRRMEAGRVVEEAARHRNACGSGAIAATLGAAAEFGATQGHLIEYTTSYDVLRDELYGDTVGDFVGYVGMVF